MPYTVKSFQATPNPNAIKCILDRPPRSPRGTPPYAPVSFRSAADLPPRGQSPVASGDSGAGRGQVQAGESEPYRLARALFAIPGVTGLLFNDDWITVNKSPQSDWAAVKAQVTRTLAEA